MNPQAQRVAIAEACPTIFHIRRQTGQIVPRGADGTEHPRPSYDPLTDLNAMHEAEKVLLQQSRASDYWTQLYSICVRDKTPGWHATAAQRAEAFLRTLNLWDDSK